MHVLSLLLTSKELKDKIFLPVMPTFIKKVPLFFPVSLHTNLWHFVRQGELFLFRLSQLHSEITHVCEISHGFGYLSQCSYSSCTNFPLLQFRVVKGEWPWWGCTGFWRTKKMADFICVKELNSVVTLILPTGRHEVCKDTIKIAS